MKYIFFSWLVRFLCFNGSAYQDSWGSMMPGVQRCQNTPISAVLQLEGSWAAEWSAPGLRLSAPLRLCPSERRVECVQVWGEEKKMNYAETCITFSVNICEKMSFNSTMHLYFTNGLCNPVMYLFYLLLGTKPCKFSPFCLQTEQEEQENLFSWHFLGINSGWGRCVCVQHRLIFPFCRWLQKNDTFWCDTSWMFHC